jgi:hypothetical protein
MDRVGVEPMTSGLYRPGKRASDEENSTAQIYSFYSFSLNAS